MASLAFFGYFFLGIGPGIIFFWLVLAPKSFLVLISFTSAFYWLLVLFITSAIFRGFLPLNLVKSSYTGLIIGSLVIQEAARYLLWRANRKTTDVLDSHARIVKHRFDVIDKLYLALAWGYGHGAAHVIFFVLSFLPLTTGDGTWYYDQCPSMSIFLVGALYALAFGMMLPCLMVLAFDGYQERKWGHVAYAPIMHLFASLLTLNNFNHKGCNATVPVLLILGVGNVIYTGWVCWSKGAHVPVLLDADLDSQAGRRSEDETEERDLRTGVDDSADVPGQPHVVPGGVAHVVAGQNARRRPRPAGPQYPLVPS